MTRPEYYEPFYGACNWSRARSSVYFRGDVRDRPTDAQRIHPPPGPEEALAETSDNFAIFIYVPLTEPRGLNIRTLNRPPPSFY